MYPRGLCRAMIKGTVEQLRLDHLLKEGCYGIQVADDDAAVAASLMGPEQGYSGKYRDDLTGQLLKDVLVEEARAKELLYFHSKGVWMKVPKSSARAQMGRPPITVRWVDVNKGVTWCQTTARALSPGSSRHTTRVERRTSHLHRLLKRSAQC